MAKYGPIAESYGKEIVSKVMSFEKHTVSASSKFEKLLELRRLNEKNCEVRFKEKSLRASSFKY